MPYIKDRSFKLNIPYWVDNSYYGTALNGKHDKEFTVLRTRTGDRLPKWRDRIRLQVNATTDMDGYFDTYDFNTGFVSKTFKHPDTGQVLTSRAHGNFSAEQLIDLYDPAGLSTFKADQRAMQAYLKNVHKCQTQFQSLTFLGEMKEAIHMIRHPAEGLRHLLDDYLLNVKKRKQFAKDDATRRRLFGKRKERAENAWKNDLSQMWLEHSFGWQPFIGDIESGVRAYETLRDRRLGNNQIPVRGFGSEVSTIPSYNAYNPIRNIPPSTSIGIVSQKNVQTASVVYKGMVKVDNTGSSLAENLTMFGLRPAEFIPTAWELLPWSFLIDYFTNIGDVLENAITDTSKLAWTNKTSISEVQQEARWDLNVSATMQSAISCNSSGPQWTKAKRKRVVRSPNVGTFVPSLSFELPGRPAQFANMLALFSQSNLIHPQRRR